MTVFPSIHKGLERFNIALGKGISWFVAIMTGIVVGIVITRTLFNTGSVAVQEVINYLHATLFLLLVTYTAQQDGHVRVDVFYRGFSKNTKSWVNACGAVVFLIPFSVFLIGISWKFASDAWSILEGSSNPGGLPAVFLLKTLIPCSGILLGTFGVTQALSELTNLTYNKDAEA